MRCGAITGSLETILCDYSGYYRCVASTSISSLAEVLREGILGMNKEEVHVNKEMAKGLLVQFIGG